MSYHISLILLIKDLINEYSNPTTQLKLTTSRKPLISHLHVLFCPGVLQKATAHVGTKPLKIHHQAQKVFWGIFVGIPQHQKGYILYISHKHNIVSSYNIIFDDILSSNLKYTSQPYSEAMDMQPAVLYKWFSASSKEKTSDIITFTHFEERVVYYWNLIMVRKAVTHLMTIQLCHH